MATTVSPTGTGPVTGADGRVRCGWCGSDPLYVDYHDEEWGVAQHDDVALFEKLCLEGFQAGLSWITVLRKRPAFRRAFAGFDPGVLVAFGEREVDGLLDDAGIVRHRGKIEATIANARAYHELVAEHGSLDAFVWRFADESSRPPPRSMADVPAVTAASTALSQELRRRGWRYVGPTTAYAFMQAMGLVDDHLEACWRRDANTPDAVPRSGRQSGSRSRRMSAANTRSGSTTK